MKPHIRRNLLAHAGGIVDSHYLAVALDAEVKVGGRLESSKEYWLGVAAAFQQLADGLATDIAGRCLKA